MAPQVSERRRSQVKVKVELGVQVKRIPSQTHVSLRSVQRFKKNILEFGTTRCPKKDSQGRPKKITPEMERVCPFYTYFFIWKNWWNSLSWNTLLHVLHSALMNKLTIYGMSLMSLYLSSVSNVCWSVSSGPKNRYKIIVLIYDFLIFSYNYRLYNGIQYSGMNGLGSYQTG